MFNKVLGLLGKWCHNIKWVWLYFFRGHWMWGGCAGLLMLWVLLPACETPVHAAAPSSPAAASAQRSRPPAAATEHNRSAFHRGAELPPFLLLPTSTPAMCLHPGSGPWQPWITSLLCHHAAWGPKKWEPLLQPLCPFGGHGLLLFSLFLLQLQLLICTLGPRQT